MQVLVVIAGVLSIVTLIAYVGGLARRLMLQATGVDITWPLLLLSLLTFGIFCFGLPTTPQPDGCYTVGSANEIKSVGFKLWLAWGTLAFLGLGAAIGKGNSLSRFAGFIFPLAIFVVVGALLGLALGDPILC